MTNCNLSSYCGVTITGASATSGRMWILFLPLPFSSAWKFKSWIRSGFILTGPHPGVVGWVPMKALCINGGSEGPWF